MDAYCSRLGLQASQADEDMAGIVFQIAIIKRLYSPTHAWNASWFFFDCMLVELAVVQRVST